MLRGVNEVALIYQALSMRDHTETSESSSVESAGKASSDPLEHVSAEILNAERVYKDVTPGSWGYARLAGVGKGAIDFPIRSKLVTIGRAGYGADCQLRSENRTVSRHHATIEWKPELNAWVITCHSKSNGLLVDGAPVLTNTPPMPLRSRNLIEVGDSAFYFLACVGPAVRVGDIDALERKIELIRSSRKRKKDHSSFDERSTKAPRKTNMESARNPRRSSKHGLLARTEHSQDERNGVYFDSKRVENPGAATFRSSMRSGRTNDGDSKDYKSKSRKVKRSHEENVVRDVSLKKRHDSRTEDEHDRLERHSSRRQLDYEQDKPEKKKKSKKKKRKKDEKKRGKDYFQSDGLGETEDEKEESPGLYERDSFSNSLRNEIVDDGFDSAPVPSLREHKMLRNSKASSSTNTSKFRTEWNKKERADFGRAIFAVGVDEVYDGDGNLVAFDWTRFRGIAKLEKKSDTMLADYYKRMMADVENLLEEEAREKRTNGPRTKHKPGCDCVVCENTRKSRRKKEQENSSAELKGKRDTSREGRRDGDADSQGGEDNEVGAQDLSGDVHDESNSGAERVIGLVTAQKLRVRMGIHEAARQVDSAAGQSVMRKLRSQPRNQAANGELPSWWINGAHDHALMIGTARHGVGQWTEIWSDRHNPEFVRVKVEQGSSIKWPMPQVAMKRLREVSSAINAEIRRMAKKKAKVASETAPKSSPPSSKKQQAKSGHSSSVDAKNRRNTSKLSGNQQKRKGTARSVVSTGASSDADSDVVNEDGSRGEKYSSRDQVHRKGSETDASSDFGAEDEDEEIEIEIEEDDAEEEEDEEEDDEEIEIEIEEDDNDDGDDDRIQYNTESDSAQSD